LIFGELKRGKAEINEEDLNENPYQANKQAKDSAGNLEQQGRA